METICNCIYNINERAITGLPVAKHKVAQEIGLNAIINKIRSTEAHSRGVCS